jgi:hypothetical protein
VAQDGKCLEGFEDLAQCPHFQPGGGGTERSETQGAPKTSPEPRRMVSLPGGAALDSEAASGVTCANISRIVVLVGEEDCGKTTLLTSLYECFQEGPFAGFLFGGSETLVGFEERCHLARVVSGRSSPVTERTKQPSFLHFRVRRETLDLPCQDVLITDLPGEICRLVRDSSDDCRRLAVLRRADHFVLLIDGAKLAARATRVEAYANAVALIRSCIDAEMLDTGCRVLVLLTKWDLIADAGRSDAQNYVGQIERRFLDEFGSRFAAMRIHRIAARPRAGSGLRFAYGLDAVFPLWVTERARRPVSIAGESIPTEREFDQYIGRRLPGARPR